MQDGDVEEDLDVEKLLAGLRIVAREEAAALASAPVDAFTPLSADERGEIAAILLARPAGAAKIADAKPSADTGAGIVSLTDARRWRRRVLTWVLPLAAAAGLALALGPLSRDVTPLPPLPAYEVTAQGGLKTVRGGPVEPTREGATPRPERIALDTELIVHARPAIAVDGPVSVRAFAIRDGTAHELPAQVELAPSGAAEVRVRPGAGLVKPGPATLRILIGRVADVRDAKPIDAALASVDASGRRWLTVPIDLGD
jgi:hypothetical protein